MNMLVLKSLCIWENRSQIIELPGSVLERYCYVCPSKTLYWFTISPTIYEGPFPHILANTRYYPTSQIFFNVGGKKFYSYKRESLNSGD